MISIKCDKEEYCLWCKSGSIYIKRVSDDEIFEGCLFGVFSSVRPSDKKYFYHFHLWKEENDRDFITTLTNIPERGQEKTFDYLVSLDGEIRYVDREGVRWIIKPNFHEMHYWYFSCLREGDGFYDRYGVADGNILQVYHFHSIIKDKEDLDNANIGLTWMKEQPLHSVDRFE